MSRSCPSHAAARVFRAAAFVLSLAATASAAHAQTWEPLGATEPDFAHFEQVYALGFFSADPDSLVIFQKDGYYLHALGQDNGDSGDWADIGHSPAGPDAGLVTADDVMIGVQGDIHVSTDRGETWDLNVCADRDGEVLLESSLPTLAGPDGTPAVFFLSNTTVNRSRGGGTRGTWEYNIAGSGGHGGWPNVLADVQPSAALPEGRLLAGVFNGTTYSDDGGETWQPSSAYGPSAFVAYAFAHLPEAGHPYGGPVFGGFDELPGEELSVWRSDDGGATWAEVHEFDHAAWGLATLDEIRLHAGRDGALYASIIDLQGGPTEDLGRILRSWDGGVTWEAADDGMRVTHGGLAFSVNQFMGGPDGRLYAATDSVVWRTTVPLPVADAPAPSASPELVVTASPNPSSGRVAVSVALPEPSASVRVEVFDGVGRRVATLHEGAARGALSLDVDTRAWAPGVYTVRVAGAAAGGAARFTVAR